MFKKAAFLTVGNALTSLFYLIRNILVARLISVEDYGIAATFAITMALIEMMSQLGLDRMIVQDKEGDKPRLQAGLQAFQLLRGLFGMALLLAIAVPYAVFLKVPEATWAYMAIAAVPAMTGLWHFDMFRAQRSMNYRPFVVAELVPALVSLLAVYPLYLVFGDWQVMLWAILLQHALTLILSHLQAGRAYRWTWEWGLLKRAFFFGAPLLVNGLLLFAVFNGEKLIVGREMGLAALGLFAMAFSLTLTPTIVLAKSAQSFFLPQLSKVQDKDAHFIPLAHATMQTSLLIGLLLIAGVVLVGPPFVQLALGEKYAPMLPILITLGLVQAVRVAKTGVAVVSLARAKTGNAMIANAPRVAALPIAWWLVVMGGGFEALIWVAIAAECVGYGVALWLARAQVGVPLRPMIWPVALTAIAFAVVAWMAVTHPPAPGLLAHLTLPGLVWLLPWIVALAALGAIWTYLKARIRKAGTQQ